MKRSKQPMVYSITDAMQLLGVSRNTVMRLIYNGHLPAIKIGTIYRIRKEDLQALLIPFPGAGETVLSSGADCSPTFQGNTPRTLKIFQMPTRESLSSSFPRAHCDRIKHRT